MLSIESQELRDAEIAQCEHMGVDFIRFCVACGTIIIKPSLPDIICDECLTYLEENDDVPF